jgi:hypothetical protein
MEVDKEHGIIRTNLLGGMSFSSIGLLYARLMDVPMYFNPVSTSFAPYCTRVLFSYQDSSCSRIFRCFVTNAVKMSIKS